MKRLIGGRIIVLIIFAFMLSSVNALGQDKGFPVKAINSFIGMAPGGATTQSGTIVCDGMKKYLKQPVVVNFKPGAAQAVAAEFVKNSKPDGYTILWAAFGDLEVKVAKDRSILKFGFEDFDSLGSACFSPYTVAVNIESSFKTVEDVVAAAKKSPGKLSYGSSGTGALGHIAGEIFSMRTGIVLNHVPFTGGAPAITASLGKHIDLNFQSVSTFGNHIKQGGGLQSLVVFAQNRDTSLPNVPTAMERGIDFTLTSWFGMLVPKGMPKDAKAVLAQALKKTVEDPEIGSMLNKMGFTVAYISPEEVDKRIEKEYKLFRDVWEKTGLVTK